MIAKMLSEFTDIKFQKTDSVLEALILEANLIKKHQPEANTDLKDDKSFNYVVITDEDFPRVLAVRGKELETAKTSHEAIFSERKSAKRAEGLVLAGGKTFGPFTNSGQLKEAMKLVRKIFPYRDKCSPHPTLLRHPLLGKERDQRERTKPCFNRQIGLCPGVCTGEISRRDYAKQIKNIVLFFEGKKKTLIRSLEKQMKVFAKAREFEKASVIKKTIFALGHIQDIALIKESQVSKSILDTNFRVESYDIAHMSGRNMVGVMTVMKNGEMKKSDYRKFHIKWFDKLTTTKGSHINDIKALVEIISRRLNHSEWPLPNLIVVDGGVAQKRAAEKVLKEKKLNIPVVAVVKDERHRPREILGMNYELRIKNYGEEKIETEELEKQILLANAEAHRFAITFHKKIRRKIPN